MTKRIVSKTSGIVRNTNKAFSENGMPCSLRPPARPYTRSCGACSNPRMEPVQWPCSKWLYRNNP